MEESGENSPSQSYLEEGDDMNDLGIDDEGDCCCESIDPMMKVTDRKKKQQEITEVFLALSETIPNTSKKMDETLILDNARKYVKELEERVKKLEKEVEYNIICSNNGATSSSCEVNSNGNYSGGIEMIPEVKVRVLRKDVLIIIHCEKQEGVMIKVLSHLENVNLSVLSSSVLRFGNSILDITVTAQMGDGYNMKVDELEKTLKAAILTQ